MPRRITTAIVALTTIVACSRGTSVGSPSPVTPAAVNAGPSLPAGVTAEMISEGKVLFEMPANNCTRCHGVTGKGGARGPDLTDSIWVQIDGSYPSIVNLINVGVTGPQIKGGYPNMMRPKGGAALTDAQVKAMAAYLYSVSHK